LGIKILGIQRATHGEWRLPQYRGDSRPRGVRKNKSKPYGQE